MTETFHLEVKEIESSEYQPYFQTYLDLVDEGSVFAQMNSQIEELRDLLGGLDRETCETVHQPYQWTLKQVVGHIIDVEKIFGCRAHRIACRENIPLPGFDQDVFAANCEYGHVDMNSLLDEFENLRMSNLLFFNRMTEEMWQQSGTCDEKEISVRAIACLLVGHVNHHSKILRKRLDG